MNVIICKRLLSDKLQAKNKILYQSKKKKVEIHTLHSALNIEAKFIHLISTNTFPNFLT